MEAVETETDNAIPDGAPHASGSRHYAATGAESDDDSDLLPDLPAV